MFFLGIFSGMRYGFETYAAWGVCEMIASVPWQMLLWAAAGLVALYFLGWEAFGPPRRARVLLMNGVGGLAAAFSLNLVAGLFGAGVTINPIAFLVVSSEGVRLIPIGSSGEPVDRVAALVPEMFDKIVSLFSKKTKDKKEEKDGVTGESE